MAAYFHNQYSQMNDFLPILSETDVISSDSADPSTNGKSMAYMNEHTGQQSTVPAQNGQTMDNPVVMSNYLSQHLYCNSMVQPTQSNYYGQPVEYQFESPSPLVSSIPSSSYGSERKSFRSSKISRREITASERDVARPSKIRKRHAPSPGISELIERVFVWDLDETAIIFQSLLTGAFARKYGKDIQTCVALGLEMEELIFYLADNFLFLKDLEDCDQVHIDELVAEDTGQDLSVYDFSNDDLHCGRSGPSFKGSSDWLKKLAFRYRRIKEIFASYQTSLQALLTDGRYDRWIRLRCEMETFTDSWTTLSHQSLSLIAHRRDCTNLLVTSSHLIPALAKLMLFGLADSFDADAVYSSAKVGKEACFERIANRFGRKTTFVVIGDGPEEESAAKQLNWPYWRVTTHSDLIALHHALDMEFL